MTSKPVRDCVVECMPWECLGGEPIGNLGLSLWERNGNTIKPYFQNWFVTIFGLG
jgi:hypothetical protein